jgi:LmbE family N-acetylglucosaminyl deacetylase
VITDAADLGTILGVWAHPDDETYLMGGLMSTATAAGRRVVCVTATRGEAGSPDLKRWPLEGLGALREVELARALAALGPIEHHWLDYPDGGCAAADAGEATAAVEKIMRAVDPDSVLTFGPDGMTGHTDHTAVCEWTTAAFERAAKPGATLYYATATQKWLDDVLPVFGPSTSSSPACRPSPPKTSSASRID